MDKSEIVRILGIAVFAVMALSMIAAVFIYVEPNNNNNNGTDPFPQAQDNTFTYTLSFDTHAIKDLSSMRFGAMTNLADKVLIDNLVLKTSGVSKVSSTFKKQNFDDNSWVYLAEVTAKKDTDLYALAQTMGDLNVFDVNAGFDSMKYISITVPSSLMIHNTDLNIDRNYVFTTSTLSVLAKQTTLVNDEIVVSGTIQLKGTAILALELTELENKTQNERISQILKQMQEDANKPLTPADNNSPIDINSPAQ